MKYSILINQLALASTCLDLADAAILDFLYVYGNSHNLAIDKLRWDDGEGGSKWTWIDLQMILNNLPLLRITSKGALTPRLKRIERAGYLTLKLGRGKKLYFRLGSKVDSVFIQMNSSIHQNEFQNSPNRINNTNKDNNTSVTNVTATKCFSPTSNHKDCISNLEDIDKDFGKKLLANAGKNIKWLEAIYKAGFNDKRIEKACNVLDEDQFYVDKGWDMKNVFDSLIKGGKDYVN